MLEKLFARFTSAPKTLPQATETITEAKTTLDSVAALFTAAGLNLEQLLAAGPDALKAHLESLDNSTELAEALQENEKLSADVTAAKAEAAAYQNRVAGMASIAATLGVADLATAEPTAIGKAFEAHVSKQTTLALAKTGHPPAHVPAADTAFTAKPTGAELHAQWKAMKVGPERLAFFSAHEAEITAFERNAK